MRTALLVEIISLTVLCIPFVIISCILIATNRALEKLGQVIFHQSI